ncbi:hypothetical protein BFJ63_vAg17909 [Fusarium oxysporum f. sp. narcissi]|uniref:Secreted in xylem 12 n=4 Tax=Fusarium oxysporum TaxID=5507 RepID=A0A4Q2V5Q6_FUSOX|nr:hypothetical protein BFJ63_vAg17909 [Fusarium oxysporum f. sp. narcissi]
MLLQVQTTLAQASSCLSVGPKGISNQNACVCGGQCVMKDLVVARRKVCCEYTVQIQGGWPVLANSHCVYGSTGANGGSCSGDEVSFAWWLNYEPEVKSIDPTCIFAEPKLCHS